MSAAAVLAGDTARDVVARSCLALDEEDTEGFLALCTADFKYRIEVDSPELRRKQLWLDHDRDGLAELLGSMSDHLRRSGRLLRHLGASICHERNVGVLHVSTSFTVLHTALDGSTALWAAGRYLDTVTLVDGAALLAQRLVDLHTRDLGIGSHVPI
jgi:methanesulfonate monooxygenase small subunit